MEQIIFDQMAKAVFGANNLERIGLGLDETIKLCMAVFNGEENLEYSDRSDEYQAKLDAFIAKNFNPSQNAVVRSRREVVQHAAAFQHIVDRFVKQGQPMTEELIKNTHAIMVRGLDPAGAGIFGTRPYGGVYRKGKAFVGAEEFCEPADVPKAMKAMVEQLNDDIAQFKQSGDIDPIMFAAKYCDRIVNVHPFQDGNGRICQLILNVLLMRYGGFVITLGEKGEDRDEYIMIASESARVGGHPGQFGKKVLEIAYGTLNRLKKTLRYHGSRLP
ncbi:Fic-domain-containing protein [Acephala macrosclerotiorum]|nr:Fic-domain-containing protein [Acephala macrosclerotiorum]